MPKLICAVLVAMIITFPFQLAAQTEEKNRATQEPQTLTEALKAVQDFPGQRVRELRAAGKPIQYADIFLAKTELAKKYTTRFSVDNVPAKDLPLLVKLYLEADQKEMARAAIARGLASGKTDTERADLYLTAIDLVLAPPVSDAEMQEAEAYTSKLDALGGNVIDQQIVAHNRLGNLYRGLDIDARIVEHEDKFLALYKKLDPEKQKKAAPRVAGAYVNLAEVYAGREENDRALAILKQGLVEFGENPQSKRALQQTIDRYSLVGQSAPAIEAPVWLNAPAEVKRVELRGKVTLMQFTAHWCGPCRKSYPTMLKMHQKYARDGLDVMFVTQLYGFFEKQQNLKPEEEVAANKRYYLEHHGLPFRIAVAESRPVPANAAASGTPRTNEERYYVGGIPQIVVIDKQGVVRSILIGWDPANETRLSQLLERLLK